MVERKFKLVVLDLDRGVLETKWEGKSKKEALRELRNAFDTTAKLYLVKKIYDRDGDFVDEETLGVVGEVVEVDEEKMTVKIVYNNLQLTSGELSAALATMKKMEVVDYWGKVIKREKIKQEKRGF